MSRLLARWAECLFWLARYMERAENLARLLEVQQTFARDSRGAQDWGVVLAINADSARFHAAHAEASPAAVIRFYTVDRSNPTSIFSDLFAARENARALRPMIPTELWMQLNTFYNRVASLSPAAVSEERLARVCALIKEGCETHAGIAAGTFFRDEAWCFYQLGAAIETADQTTRLLDAKLFSFEVRGGEAGAFAAVPRAVTGADGAPLPWAYFWFSGVLSSFLDNAPTYLVFFNTAGGDPQVLMAPLASTLAAISAGSVFMGANTYIGNAPNFMVKAIAEERG